MSGLPSSSANLPLSRDAARYDATLLAAIFPLAFAGCATWQAPAGAERGRLRARAVTATRRGARERGRAERRRQPAHVRRRVNATDIQPVWIEVRNMTPQPLWLLSTGTDPDYFSPLEVAWSAHAPLARNTNARIDEHFDRLGFNNPIAPGATRSDSSSPIRIRTETAQHRSVRETDA